MKNLEVPFQERESTDQPKESTENSDYNSVHKSTYTERSMIETTIPEILGIVGIPHTGAKGRGRSECPLHGEENPVHFSFSRYMARCSACGWIGDPTDLAKKLELFSPGEVYQDDEITSALFAALPSNPEVLEVNNLLSLARAKIVQVMWALTEMWANLEMKEALFQIECETRWSEYLDRVDHLHARRKVIVAGDDTNEN
jgi:hypothetical protein